MTAPAKAAVKGRVYTVGRCRFAELLGFNGAKHRFTLAASDAAADSLPVASTCFNTLKLPAYPSAAALRAKLGLALAEGAGFDEAATAEH